ncbi:MAG: AraC family transcriptional regulator [Kofleriaceae bacterium]
MRLDDDLRRRLSLARDLLEREHADTSLGQVARQAGVSPHHFIRLFEAAFGATPHRYRTGVRLARARRLLARGAPVTEVCLELGFSSLGSFSALFSRYVGEPPSRYQRRIRASVQVPADLARHFFPGCLSLLGALPRGAFRNFQEA